MSRLSSEKEAKIKSDILATLFQNSPKAIFTAEISRIIARDEEFVKRLLHNLFVDGLTSKVDKNPKGIKYLKRERWRLSSKAFKAYSELQ